MKEKKPKNKRKPQKYAILIKLWPKEEEEKSKTEKKMKFEAI